MWYRRLIAKALIFRRLETEVPKQSRYEGGYRANIVTYAMAKVLHDATDEKQVLDLDAVWRRQAVPDALSDALMVAAAEAHDVITHPPHGVRNMSEWAKQQACWNGLKSRKLDYDDAFDSCLVLIDEDRRRKGDEKNMNKQDDGINAQNEVVTLGAGFWSKVPEKGAAQETAFPGGSPYSAALLFNGPRAAERNCFEACAQSLGPHARPRI